MAWPRGFFNNALITINVLFVIFEITWLVFSLIMFFKIVNINDDIANTLMSNNLPVFLHSFAVIIIAPLGCYAAVRENAWSLKTYTTLMGAVFVSQTVLIIFVCLNRHKFLEGIDNFVGDIWNRNEFGYNAMDKLQIEFNCCGKDSFADYFSLNKTLPNSCCGGEATPCTAIYAFQEGCAGAFSRAYKSHFDIIIYARPLVADIELIGFGFAVCLAKQASNKRKYGEF